MAHFAELNEQSEVIRVIVVSNFMIVDSNGNESETIGVEFCKSLYGPNTLWVQTSYNGNFRKNYAGIGCTYDVNRDAFIAPKPEGDGWILDEETCRWRNPEREAAQSAVNLGVYRV